MSDLPRVFAVSPTTAIRVGLKLFLGGLWNLVLRREVVIEVEPE